MRSRRTSRRDRWMPTAPLSPERSHAVGRAARVHVPRGRQHEWRRPDGGTALHWLRAQESIRAPGLLPLRYGRMTASPWTYFRGAAAVMAADLAGCPHTGLLVQLCGDAHVLNFGLWATPERQLSFDLRDFDETLPGPFEWDVMRMVASLQVLGRGEDLVGAVGAQALDRALRAALGGYRAKIAEYADARFLDIWYDQITAEDLLDLAVPEERADRAAALHKQAHKRSNAGAAKKFSEL